MKRLHRAVLSTAIATLMIPAAAACSSSSSGATKTTGVESIGISVSNATDPYVVPWLVGQKEGLFERDGVGITKIVSGKGGTSTLQTQLSGDLPIGEVSYPAVVQAKAKGAPVVAIGGATQSLYGLDFYAMTGNSAVKTINDVKTWAYTNPGSVTQALTYLLPQKAGVSDRGMKRVAAGGVGEGIALLESGKVDVAVIPAAVERANPGKFRLVVSSSKVLGSFQQSVITSTSSYVNTHTETVKAVLAGYNDSVKWISGHIDQAAALYAKQINISVAAAKTIIEDCVKANNWGVGINPQALRTAGEALKLGGFNAKIDYCSIFNTAFLPSGVATTLPTPCGS